MHNVLEQLHIDTKISLNPYSFEQNDLFAVAARINKKRQFLFVSKVLGKHLSVQPQIPLLTGMLLAIRYKEVVDNEQYPFTKEIVTAIKTKQQLQSVYEKCIENPVVLNEQTLVIGFAETATALGHAFFSMCDGQVAFIHTTREEVYGQSPIISFEEEHSHATSHRIYAENSNLFMSCKNIILVDDEMTTGQTNINIIEQIKKTYPHIERFSVVSILDWRNRVQREAYRKLEQTLNITIDEVTLMAGDMHVEGAITEGEHQRERAHTTTAVDYFEHTLSSVLTYPSKSEDGELCLDPYFKGTGRFSVTVTQERMYDEEIKELSTKLSERVSSGKKLVIGTGECMYVPLRIAANLGENTSFQSTTRSPIYVHEHTLIYNKFCFASPENSSVANYLYNIPMNYYEEIIIIVERIASEKGLQQLIDALSSTGSPKITVVTLVNHIALPNMKTSYDKNDVEFLLRDLSHIDIEKDTEEREYLIQQGTHYSEMLPVEFHPNEQYMELFYKTLQQYGVSIAIAVGVVAEKIRQYKSLDELVLVSLARAGTPIGILIKRYYEQKYGISVPHYCISIIRNLGIDETALLFILNKHPKGKLQFIDGWTGKGVITKELTASCEAFNAKYGTSIDHSLAVLADPGDCAAIYGTRDDFLIPSACLNSTVSGLVSRTVLNKMYLKAGDFHGAKYYEQLADIDVSQYYIAEIVKHYESINEEVMKRLKWEVQSPNWNGMKSVKTIQQQFDIKNVNHIKPGVGETTRVLLRRVPWKILVNPKYDKYLQHIYLLAQQRGVLVEPYTDMDYACCGLIKELNV